MRLTLLALTLTALTALSACQKDESLHAFVPEGSLWHLTELGGKTFTARAILTFPKPDSILGQGPCNTYGATQNAPYPWFEIGPIQATKLACDTLEAEQAYFTALSAATFAEVSGDTLILSDETGALLTFKIR